MWLSKRDLWVVVTNGSIARVLSVINPKLVHLIKEMKSDAVHMHARELTTDRPGRVFESAGPIRHSIEPKLDQQQKEKLEFIHNLAEYLNNSAATKDFVNLILIAPPETLGNIRPLLSKKTNSLIIGEIDKDLTHLREGEIIDYLGKS